MIVYIIIDWDIFDTEYYFFNSLVIKLKKGDGGSWKIKLYL